jgi:hypothetical protein
MTRRKLTPMLLVFQNFNSHLVQPTPREHCVSAAIFVYAEGSADKQQLRR